jgi:hypothetical protein
MTNDSINALFELSGALFVLNNCRILYSDKLVRGVSVLTTVFFTLWGFWNCYFYPILGQEWSFVAGMCISASNLLWIAMMIYYKRKETKESRTTT